MNRKSLQWAVLILLALVWGSSFILMKRGMIAFTSEQVGALRIFIAFLFLVPLIPRHLKKSELKNWKYFLYVGALGNFIPAFLFTKAETQISSSLAGMLNSFTPLFTLILGILIFRTKTTLVNLTGIVIGFIGALTLITGGAPEAGGGNYKYGFLVLLATFFYGISVNVIKKFLAEVNSISITVWAFSLVGPIAGAYLFTTDFTQRLTSHPEAFSSLGYVAILAIVGTASAVILFNVLIKNTSAVFASSVTYLIPVVAIGWGFFDNETIEPMQLVSILVILGGIYLVNKKPAEKVVTQAPEIK